MAVSQDDRYGLLHMWQEINHINIWKFNQANGDGVPKWACGVTIQQERDMIARALTDAQDQIIPFFNTYFTPQYVVDEVLELQSGWYVNNQALYTDYSHVQALGTRANTLIEADASIVYSTEHTNLPVTDTATITVTTSVDPSEIQVFFRVADGADGAADQYWRIHPLRITSDGTTATITGHRALFVEPSIWARPFGDEYSQRLHRNEADTTDVDDFVTQVDVYRVYTDSTDAVRLTSTGCNCNCLYDASTSLTAMVVNSRLGEINVDCPTCSACVGRPKSLKISYLAGVPLVNGKADRTLSRALIRLANANMAQYPCGGCEGKDIPNVFESDVERADAANRMTGENPFGLRLGHVEAWKAIKNSTVRTGVGGRA